MRNRITTEGNKSTYSNTMSLYDDAELVDTNAEEKVAGWAAGVKLLQSQMQPKKATITQPKREQMRKNQAQVPTFGRLWRPNKVKGLETTTVTTTTKKPKKDTERVTEKLRKIPIRNNRVIIGVKPGMPDEFKYGVEDEYDPFFPNDYEKVKQEFRLKRDSLSSNGSDDKRQYEDSSDTDDTDEFTSQSNELDTVHSAFVFNNYRFDDQTARKEAMGAAIAPPSSLLEPVNVASVMPVKPLVTATVTTNMSVVPYIANMQTIYSIPASSNTQSTLPTPTDTPELRELLEKNPTNVPAADRKFVAKVYRIKNETQDPSTAGVEVIPIICPKVAHMASLKGRHYASSSVAAPMVTSMATLFEHSMKYRPTPVAIIDPLEAALVGARPVSMRKAVNTLGSQVIFTEKHKTKVAQWPESTFKDKLTEAKSVAAKIMAKYGFKQGPGLEVEKMAKRSGRNTHKEKIKPSPATVTSKPTQKVDDHMPKRSGRYTHKEKIKPPPATVTSEPTQKVNDHLSKVEEPPKKITVTKIMKQPSKVVLLKNMVGPGKVDEELEPEVKDECNTKYGEVANVVIHEVHSVVAEEAVRIFVEFKRVESAVKAVADLNGRFFGGREVKAAFYDVNKFQARQLTD